jgi:hypothetical protein
MDITRKLGYLLNEESQYQKFVNKKLKKYGVNSPAELKGDQKKKFYDEVDKEWKGKKESD